jgi:hypothetical protein
LPDPGYLRSLIEDLIDRSWFEDDSGGRGVGPTLGVRKADDSQAGRSPPASLEPRIFADLEDTTPPSGPVRGRGLGSEIARAGLDLGDSVLRTPDDVGPTEGARRARPRAFPSPADPESVADEQIDERQEKARAAADRGDVEIDDGA